MYKDVINYEGLYKVNPETAEIISVNYNKTGVSKQIKTYQDKKTNYCRVRLSKNGKVKTYYVHRIVWESVNGKIPKQYQINHIDENKSNNSIDNLELLTPIENINYGTHTKRSALKRSKTVYQYTLDGILINVWTSIAECRRNGYNNVCNCCNGKSKTASGYKWSY